MPEQEHYGQPDGSEFKVEDRFEQENGDTETAEVAEKADSSLEDEGRYDEQKAATIGAAVLEQDGLNASRGGGTDKFKGELAAIDENISRVEDGGLSTVLGDNSGRMVSIPIDAQAIRRSVSNEDELRHGRLREKERMNAYDVEKAEAELTQEQADYADRLERKRQEYDEYVAELEYNKRALIARGKDEAEVEKYHRTPTFAEYLHDGSVSGFRATKHEIYPELDTNVYRHIGDLEGRKARHAEYKKELSEIELAELEKMRGVKRETMQKYLNQQSDYYAELYELNPDLFAAMPTKEFMEHRDELARIEQPIGSWEYMKDQYADVVDTMQGVVKNVEARNGTLVTLDEDGYVESRIDYWFEPDYLQKIYVGAVLGKTFFLRDVENWNYPQEKARDFLKKAHDDVESDFSTGWLKYEGRANEAYFPYHAEEMKTFIHAVDDYFADYNRRILDVTPRQLFEGFSGVVEKLKTDVEGRITQAKAEADGLKAQFAPQQESASENNQT